MASSGENYKQLHVAMFPWLAFGHIIPFFHLSKSIAQKGHKVSFLSTTRNIKRLPTLPCNLEPHVNLVQLTLPHVNGLPDNAEATMDVCLDDVQYLKKAFDGLEPQVSKFLEKESPDWIIYDFAPYWLPQIAAGLGISRGFLSIFTAWSLSFLGPLPKDDIVINGSEDVLNTIEDFIKVPSWIPFESNLCFRKHEAKLIVGSSEVNASGVTDVYRMQTVIKGSECVFVRYCYEFEPQWLTLTQQLNHIPVVPVGLLQPETATGEERISDTWMRIKNWLDGQPKGKVIYVALGSEVNLSKTQIGELALGLEISGLPFFWVLRKPFGEDSSLELLPDGFLERTVDRGMVWTSWVPQMEILSHKSVGGFLSHSGWSSIIEGLMFGHHFVLLPFLADQGLNARVFVEKQIGIEVPRNDEDGSFTREDVAKTLTSVFIDDQGKVYKEKTMAWSRIFGDTKLQNKYIHNFVSYLENHKCVADI